MNTLSAKELIDMFVTGAFYLKNSYKQIDDLNVFPVPDGDTGSNMLSTTISGIKELQRFAEQENILIGDVTKAFSKGLLFGARGNSGVIFSQIFAGLNNADYKGTCADRDTISEALKQSKISAYKSVVVPVEGTILTVVNDATKAVNDNIEKFETVIELFEFYLKEAEESLNRTPLLLPVLKEAGVVDSGGAGFLTFFKGMVAGLKGEIHTIDEVLSTSNDNKSASKSFMDYDFYQLNQYGYCTEFTIRLNPNCEFDKEDFSKKLEYYGYSIVVVNNDDIVKCHIHTNTPGDVFTFAQRYGALCAVKADNMAIQTMENSSLVAQKVKKTTKTNTKKEKYGIVAVVNGDGLKEMFMALGVNEIIDGGQTMNPSTQDFIDAIKKVNAEHVFVIPNNKNVYMSAKAAKALINDRHVIVLPAKTISQGYAAMTCFDQTETPKQITKDMETKIASVRTGEVTYAIRNSVSSGIEIKKDDFIGILDGQIINSLKLRTDSTKDLIKYIITDESTQITIFYGEDVNEEEVSDIESYINDNYPDVFCQFVDGGQKIYSYIIEVE